MSGFEIVGVVLGFLPLIVSAIEDYEKIISPIITYRQYSRALKTFTTELNVQRDIFQNECIWILSRFVDGHELEDMLRDSSHSLRNVIKQDRSLDVNVSSTIGPHYGQLRDILQLITISLDEIHEETKHLSEGLSRPSRTDDGQVDLKAWKSQVKQKMKLSLKKDSLNEKVNNLRHRNQAFLAISQQIVRFNASWTPAQTPRDEQSNDKSLDKIHKLRSASKTLHHHLAKLWSCPTHAEHSANIRLCLETSELYLDAPPKMSFDMALTYWDVDKPTPGYQNPVLLAIESTAEATSTADKFGKTTVRFREPEGSEEFKSVQIHRQTSARLDRKANPKAVRTPGFRGLLKKFKDQYAESEKIASNATVASQKSFPVTPQIKKPAEPPVPDLGSVPDLCLCILETSRTGIDSNTCVGYLAGVGTDKYMVYTRQAASSTFGGGTMSLSTLIASHRRHQNLPKSDKWRLAGALSLAVLLYHSTPWLQSELKSDDIIFFGHDDQWQQGLLKAPHLHSFHRNKGKASDKSSLSKHGWIKNEMLYCLGVLLLEIEFEATLESLIADSTFDRVAALQPVMLLKRRAGRELGTLYGRIARMCLDCDFGLGLDEYSLDDPRVQKIFYTQVVKQFQERMPEYNKIWSDE